MIIGLDFDGTVTEDEDIFKIIIKLLRCSGHKVYIVTMRYPSECVCIKQEWGSLVDGIIPTSRLAKLPAVTAAGIKIDVWMDDNPRAINESAADIWGTPSDEGTVIIVNHATGANTPVNSNATTTPQEV